MKIKTNILNGRNDDGSFVSFGMVDGTQGGYYSPTISDSGELTYRASDDRMPEIEWRNIVGPPATTDKTLSEAGKMADAQVVGEEFTSIDALLKNTKKSDIEIERRITNLEYALDDYLYRPEIDDTPAYIKTVPDGVLPKATLDSYGGKSLVWNQLINNPEFSDGTSWGAKSGSMSYSDGVATYMVAEKYNAARLEQTLSHGLIVGHKYFSRVYVNLIHESNVVLRIGGSYSAHRVTLKQDVWSEIYYVRNATEDDASVSFFRVFIPTDGEEWNVGDTWKVKSPLVVDLTQMFGAGNEPTADEFNAMFPDDYYPYNPGEIISAGVSEIVSSAGTTITIPTSIASLPGYGWSAGSVCNEVDLESGQYIQRVGSYVLTGVDIDSYGVASTGVPYVRFNSTIKAGASNDLNMITNHGDKAVEKVVSESGCIRNVGGALYRYDSAYESLSDAKARLDANPLIVYYKLSKPIITDISDLLPDNVLEVEAGGTITFENEHKLPVPNQITYLVKTEGG